MSGGLTSGFGALAIAGVGGAATAAAIAGTIATIATVSAITTGLQLASSVLGLGPKAPKPASNETAVKSTRPQRSAGYGRDRCFGSYICYETATTGEIVDVFAFRDGQADAIEEYYLGDELVATTTGSVAGLADGSYSGGSTTIVSRLGFDTETAFANIIALLPGKWTSAHRGDGVVTGAVTFNPVKAKNSSKIYPNGKPPLSTTGRWQLCYDPREPFQVPDNPGTWTWTENAVLHLLHYKLYREKSVREPGNVHPTALVLQAAYDRYFAPTEQYWIDAADDADIAMALKAGGTEPRYRSSFSHNLNDPAKLVTTGLLACFDGFIAPRADGALVVYSGRYYAPTVTIGPDEIVNYSILRAVLDEDALNELVVDYVSSEHKYAVVQTTPWRNEADILTRGAIRTDSLSNPVPSHAQAGRLAKRVMARAMAPRRGTTTTNSAGRAVMGQRYIQQSIIEMGVTIFEGPVEITAVTRNFATGGVTYNWVLADPDIDDWDEDTEEGDPAPLVDRVVVAALDDPVITSATASFASDSGAGASGVKINLDVDGPDRDDLIWFARTRVAGSTVWDTRNYDDIDPGASVELLTEFVAVDASVEVEVQYQVGDGRFSDWSATETVDTSSAGIAPGPTTMMTATGGVGSALIDWRNPSSANFDHTKVFRGTTTTFGSASQVGSDRPGAPGSTDSYSDTATAGIWYYWTVAYNGSGTASSPTGPYTATVT